MSILCKQQICINIQTLRVLGDLSYGKYSLQIKIYEQFPTFRKLSLPISVIPNPNQNQSNNSPILTQKCYYSSTFRLSPNSEKQICEIVYFDHEYEILSCEHKIWSYNKICLNVECKLLHCDYEEPQIKGSFDGKMIGGNLNQSFVLDFWQSTTPCQFLGSIHACAYCFYYSPTDIFGGNFEDFCRSLSKESAEQLLKMLLKQIDQSSLEHEKFMKTVGLKTQDKPERPSRQSLDSFIEQKRQSYEKRRSLQPKQSLLKEEQCKIQEQESTKKRGFAGFKPQEQQQQWRRVTQKQRRYYSLRKYIDKQSSRIFISPQKRRQENFINKISIDEFQKILNSSCGRLYEKWSKDMSKVLYYEKNMSPSQHPSKNSPKKQEDNFISTLIHKISTVKSSSSELSQKKNEKNIVHMLDEEYSKKVKLIILRDMANLEGDWDIDRYAQELGYRNRIAKEVRKTALNPSIFDCSKFKYPLRFFNVNLFHQYNPIFFDEKVEKSAGKTLHSLVDKFHSIISQDSQEKKSLKIHLIIMVHGMGGSRYDMAMLKSQIKRHYYEKREQYRLIVSCANQNKTDEDIGTMGVRLASETRQAVARVGKDRIDKISFIGHSLGGIIIRSALPLIQELWVFLYSFVSFSSPHLGFSAPSSKLIDAGIWIMNNWNKTDSITQLTLADADDKYQSFLCKLSHEPGLQHFKKITLFSSQQDMLVPYYSARIQRYDNSSKIRIRISRSKDKIKQKISQKYHKIFAGQKQTPNNPFTLMEESMEQMEPVDRARVSENQIHNRMCENLIARIRDRNSKCMSLKRVQVNFAIPEQNIDKLIGRAAHLAYLNNFQFLRLFLHPQSQYLF